jgi:TRAP-type C4-dicarboxylate transport system substrate-binding protein
VLLTGCGKKSEAPAIQADLEIEPITLTYANFPPASTFPCVQMERWKEEVEKRTDGLVTVQTFPGGTLLNAKNIYDGVVAGTADIGNFAMSYQPGRFPVSAAVDLPLGFADARAATLTLYDLIEKHQPAEFADVKVLTVFTCPPASLMTSTPVRRLEDLDGMELRVSGTGAEVIERLGGTPVAMPQSETPDAIQRGVVKGMVSSMEILKDFNFAAYCPYATRVNLNVIGFAVVMNRERWDALPDTVKAVLDELSRDQAEWTASYVDAHVEEALEWAAAERKHQVFEFPDADLARIPEILKPMLDAYVEETTAAGLDGQAILDDVLRLQAKYESAAD